MIDTLDALKRDIALARLCLHVGTTGVTTDDINGLKPYMDDQAYAMLTLTNLVRMMRTNPAKTFNDIQTQLSYITQELGIAVNVPAILRAMNFMDAANTSADVTTLVQKYKDAAQTQFTGDWRKITLETARTMLSALVARAALANERDTAQSIISTLEGFDAEEIERLANVDVGFLWGQVKTDE